MKISPFPEEGSAILAKDAGRARGPLSVLAAKSIRLGRFGNHADNPPALAEVRHRASRYTLPELKARAVRINAEISRRREIASAE